MKQRILEVNVDDLHCGGVYSLVKNVVQNKQDSVVIDIASIEKFTNLENINNLNKYGTNVYYIGYSKNKLLKQIICFNNLKKLIIKNRYNCIHIHSDVANKLLVFGIAAKVCGIKKIILHSHAAGVDGNYRKMKWIIHHICNRFLKYVGTELVACSDLAAKWMFPNVNQESIKIINNGIELEKFRFDEQIRKKIRKEMGLENKYIVGHVGRFAYQKNHKYLIRIFYEVVKKNKNAILLLIGEGPLESEIRNYVDDLNINENVIFYGTSNRVNDLFQAMDIFVLPSHFEGLPVVGVEAQASGLPVLLSNQITKETKLIETVNFLPINECNIVSWVDSILKYRDISREDTYLELKKKGFSIKDTINTLLKLYN